VYERYTLKKGRKGRISDLMIRKFKNIVSLLFLIAFLLPSIVKLGHHHEHFICKAKNETNLHVRLDKCIICNFEFASFLSDIENIDLQKDKPIDPYCNQYVSLHNYNLIQYSFLLRAPPCI